MTIKRMAEAIQKFLMEVGLPTDALAVVTAGGAMFVRGLRPSFKDIDLYVPALTAEHIQMVIDGIEVDAHRNYFTPDLEKKIVSEAEAIEGMTVMSLESILQMKRMLNRAKDQADILILEKAISDP